MGLDGDTPLMVAELRQLGGALGRPAPGAGVLSHLDGAFALFCGALALDQPSARAVETAAGQVVRAVSPWSSGGRYLNLTERPVDARSAYPDGAYARLAALRADVDPDGLLRASHPIC